MTPLEHAVSLAARGFWVFPILPEGAAYTDRQGKAQVSDGKHPAVTGWQAWATNDPAKLTRYWTRHENYNLGISTGKYGPTGEQALVVVDVDCKKGKRGDLTLMQLDMDGSDFPHTLQHATPHDGRHLIYWSDQPLKQGTDVLGDGLDIRSAGGYIVAPGSSIGGKPYKQINGYALLAECPPWLSLRLGTRRVSVSPSSDPIVGVDPDRAALRATEYLKSAPPAIQDRGGDTHTFMVCAKVKDRGVTQKVALALLLEHWNPRCEPPWEADELALKVGNAYKHGQEQPGCDAPEAVFTAVPYPADYVAPVKPPKPPVATYDNEWDHFNDNYAFTVAGGGHIIWETTDEDERPVLKHLDLATFHTQHASEKTEINGKLKVDTKLWLESPARRSCDGFIFDPTPLSARAPGWEPSPRWYNLWKGFTVEPVEGKANHPALDLFLKHALDNVCQGDPIQFHWLMGWFAHMIQKPQEKPLTALAMKGGKGSGKNTLVERVGHLLGPHFLLTSKRRYLIGQFNGHFENNLCLCLDEAFWSGDKEGEGILKDLITGTFHNIELKGKEAYKIINLTRTIIMGNEDWLIPASHDERRYAVFQLKAANPKVENRKAFCTSIRTGMEADGSLGYRHLLRYFLDFDLSTVDVNEAPRSEALLMQKISSMPILDQWWFDCLKDGRVVGADFSEEWPKEIPTNKLREAYHRWLKDKPNKDYHDTSVSFGVRLHKLASSIDTRNHGKTGKDSARSYLLPDLEVLRDDFAKHLDGDPDLLPWGSKCHTL